MLTYKEIYEKFREQNPDLDIMDYRPCIELFDVPNMDNAIVVWLKDGSTIIYQIEVMTS